MMSLFKESYTPSPTPVLLKEMFDVRSWLKPINPQLRNISNPHIFVIEKSSVTGDVQLRYKHWSRDKLWKPSKTPGEELVVLKHVSTVEAVIFIHV